MKKIDVVFDQVSREFYELLRDEELYDKIISKIEDFNIDDLDNNKIKEILSGKDNISKKLKPKIFTMWYILTFFGTEIIDNFEITDKPHDNAIDFIIQTENDYTLGQTKISTRTSKKETLLKDIERFLIKAKDKINEEKLLKYNLNLIFLTTVEVNSEIRNRAYQRFREIFMNFDNVKLTIIDINDIYNFIIDVEEGILNVKIELKGYGGYCKAPNIEIENSEGKKISLKVYNVFLRAKELVECYDRYTYRLFFPNIRSYLTLRSRVNKDIKRTAESQGERFVFYNNGIVLLTKNVKIFENDDREVIVKLDGIGIVNGAQTISSTYEAFKNSIKNGRIKEDDRAIKVLIPTKIVEISDIDEEFILDIARYSNSQNIIRPEDLFSVKGFHALLKVLFERFGILYEYKRGKLLEDSKKYRLKIKRDDLLVALWYFYSSKFGLDTTLAHKKDKLIRKLMDEDKDLCDKLYKYETLKELKASMKDAESNFNASEVETTLNWFYFPYVLFNELTKLQNKYSRQKDKKLTKIRGIRFLLVWLVGKKLQADVLYTLPKSFEISEKFVKDFVKRIDERNILYVLDGSAENIWIDNPNFKLYDVILKYVNLNDLSNIKNGNDREKVKKFLKIVEENVYPILNELINEYFPRFTK